MTPDYVQPEAPPARPKLELPAGWVDPTPLTEEEMRRMDAEGMTLGDAIRILEAEFRAGGA
jgi:hypothetical protein